MPDYLIWWWCPSALLILAVVADALIGPSGRMIGDGVAFAVRHRRPAALLRSVRIVWLPVRAAGDHRRTRTITLAIDLQMIQSMGGTPVWPLIALSNIAQGSAVIGIIISSRKHNDGDLCACRYLRLAWVTSLQCTALPETSLPDAVRDDLFWSRRIAMRPERRYGESVSA